MTQTKENTAVTRDLEDREREILIGRQDHFCPVFEFKIQFLCHYGLI